MHRANRSHSDHNPHSSRGSYLQGNSGGPCASRTLPTCANDIGVGARVGVASIAGAFDGVGAAMMRAKGIGIASTILHQTAV